MKNKKIFGIERILRKRNFGGILFINIIYKKKLIQIIAKKKNIKNFKNISKKIKIGDYIYFKGIYIINKKGILCINTKLIKIITKNKLLIPDKKKNIKNKKIKYIKRYFELFFNKKSIKKINIRNKFIKNLRNYMNKKKFIELETPILNKTKGSAEAQSFITYNKTLKKNMYLRISPEIYMKKSLIIGYKKIFEIGKNFRNEGISKNHYPEFSFMEYYAVLTNYKWSMKFLEKMIKINIFLLTKKKYLKYKKKKIFYLKKFKKTTIKKIIIKFFPKTIKKINNLKYFKNKTKKYIKDKDKNKINNIEFLRYTFFEKKISKKITYPTFIKHFPTTESPLAKKTKNNSNIVERFELYFCNKEIANGYSELNIAKEQKKRFLKQKGKSKDIDKLFIEYLKFGMLPASGCGIGIDRILMIITNSKNIKETILFP